MAPGSSPLEVGDDRADHRPLTRGFLFADLCDYTAYAEVRGDRSDADLLDRFRVLVRETIGRAGGAEIRTEGDSFFVVFPSASAVVGAGLAIVAAAAEASAADPDVPIRVGVGIHAGETEERAEGYVGTAVNVAARVCAEAGGRRGPRERGERRRARRMVRRARGSVGRADRVGAVAPDDARDGRLP